MPAASAAGIRASKVSTRPGGLHGLMSLAQATRRTARVKKPSYLASGLLLLATAAGGVRAADLLSAETDPHSLQFAGATWTVTDVSQVVGVAQQDLGMGGMAHNISGYVSDSQRMVRVSFTVAAGDHRTPFDPAQLRAYEVGHQAPIQPTGGTLGAGVLAAHAQVDGSVTFVVSRDGGHLVLRAPGSPEQVDLTTVDTAAPGTTTDHHDHAH
jgi:hypothetical protein